MSDGVAADLEPILVFVNIEGGSADDLRVGSGDVYSS